MRATTAGRFEYSGSCASCHGATGDGRGVFGQTTYPLPTDLTSAEAMALSEAQLFWITKNA
jgi:mono/diheme cytochrome c family protein